MSTATLPAAPHRVIRAPRHASDVAVVLRPDALEHGVAVMVILPRDAFSEAMRARIRDIRIDRLTQASDHQPVILTLA